MRGSSSTSKKGGPQSRFRNILHLSKAGQGKKPYEINLATAASRKILQTITYGPCQHGLKLSLAQFSSTSSQPLWKQRHHLRKKGVPSIRKARPTLVLLWPPMAVAGDAALTQTVYPLKRHKTEKEECSGSHRSIYCST